jgi:hypothetical protein
MSSLDGVEVIGLAHAIEIIASKPIFLEVGILKRMKFVTREEYLQIEFYIVDGYTNRIYALCGDAHF